MGKAFWGLITVTAFLAMLAGEVQAYDGDGVEVLPWKGPGGAVSGVVEVSEDGSATVKGQVQGVPFTSSGKVTRGSNGAWHFESIYSDGDLLCRQKTWIPLSINYTGDSEDATDGDPDDDDVGTMEVRSQTGMGKGEIQLQG